MRNRFICAALVAVAFLVPSVARADYTKVWTPKQPESGLQYVTSCDCTQVSYFADRSAFVAVQARLMHVDATGHNTEVNHLGVAEYGSNTLRLYFDPARTFFFGGTYLPFLSGWRVDVYAFEGGSSPPVGFRFTGLHCTSLRC